MVRDRDSASASDTGQWLAAGGANATHTPGFPSDPRLEGLPSRLHYLDEPPSETTNDIYVRWNAPLVYITAHLATPAP